MLVIIGEAIATNVTLKGVAFESLITPRLAIDNVIIVLATIETLARVFACPPMALKSTLRHNASVV
jgi:hypothetical protein